MSQLQSDVIIISQTPWYGNYTKSTVELAKALSQHRRVFFVDYPFTLKDLFLRKSLKIRHLWNIIFGVAYSPSSFPNLIIVPCTPFVPINWVASTVVHDCILRLNVFFLNRRIAGIRRAYKVKHAKWIAAMAPATAGTIQRYWPNEQFWYYAYDQIAAARYMKVHGARWERKLLPAVYGVICSSQALMSEKRALNNNTHLIENGVNYDLFCQYTIRQDAPKDGIGALYVGAIDSRIDVDMIEHTAQRFSGIQFSFIGPVHDQSTADALQKLPNTRLHPPIAPEYLGTVMSNADVGIIPFRTTEFTRFIYPMKVNEYLSVGLPVVASDFADFGNLKQIIHVVRHKDDLLTALLTASTQKTQDSIAQRKAVAKSNSWNCRGILLSDVLNQINCQTGTFIGR